MCLYVYVVRLSLCCKVGQVVVWRLLCVYLRAGECWRLVVRDEMEMEMEVCIPKGKEEEIERRKRKKKREIRLGEGKWQVVFNSGRFTKLDEHQVRKAALLLISTKARVTCCLPARLVSAVLISLFSV